jgi:hypothetical protein
MGGRGFGKREVRWWRFPVRKLFIGLLALSLVLLGTMLPLTSPWRCPVTEEAADRIERGMTLAEVEGILGGPTGDYRTIPRAALDPIEGFSGGDNLFNRCEKKTWEGDEGDVEVYFLEDRVVALIFRRIEPSPPGPVDIALWRLKRLEDRWLP